jgi:hypothetical protein
VRTFYFLRRYALSVPALDRSHDLIAMVELPKELNVLISKPAQACTRDTRSRGEAPVNRNAPACLIYAAHAVTWPRSLPVRCWLTIIAPDSMELIVYMYRIIACCSLIVLAEGCSRWEPRTTTDSPHAPSASASRADKSLDSKLDQPESSAGSVTPGVRAWIDEVLLEQAYKDPPSLRKYIALEARGGVMLSNVYLEADDYYPCHGLTEQEIDFLVAVGPKAIPDLMTLVRDDRPTNIHFTNLVARPSLPNQRPTGPLMLVGEVACFLIEAILRDGPCFTRTGRLLSATADISTLEGQQHALAEAAAAYENWFTQCFDRATNAIVCDDLPRVHWDYDAPECRADAAPD